MKEIPEDVQLISSETKINLSEREFFKKVVSNFTTYNKIIVENKYSVQNASSVLKRFIVFNSNWNIIASRIIATKQIFLNTIIKYQANDRNWYYYRNKGTVETCQP